MDIDRDLDFLSSSDEDVVRWQSSQTSCAALQTLLAQSSTSTQQCLPNHRRLTVWDPPSTTTSLASGFAGWLTDPHPATTASAPPQKPHPRPVAGSSRSSRPPPSSRHPTLRRSHTSPSPSTTPTNGDPSGLIALIRGVSQRVDENAQIKTKYLTRLRASNDHATTRTTKRASTATARRASSNPIHRPPEKNKTGKDELPPPVAGRRSWPDLGTSDISMDSESNGSSSSFPDTHPSSSALHAESPAQASEPGRSTSSTPTLGTTSMPPPPVPVPKPPYLSTNNTSESRSSAPQNPSTNQPSSDEPRMHPLLLAPNRRPPQPAPVAPPSSSLALRLSSRRPPPPALGMRRTSSAYTSTTFTPSQVLPQKQKGFKPPLTHYHHHPPLHPKSTAYAPSAIIIHGGTRRDDDERHSATPPTVPPRTPPKSSRDTQQPTSPSTDGDFSFGDIDMDALEETMKQYD